MESVLARAQARLVREIGGGVSGARWALALRGAAPFWIPGTPRRQGVALALSGVVWTAFGVVTLNNPRDGALVLLTLIAAFAIAGGATLLAASLGLVHRHEGAS